MNFDDATELLISKLRAVTAFPNNPLIALFHFEKTGWFGAARAVVIGLEFERVPGCG
jgi:hypothetical protein